MTESYETIATSLILSDYRHEGDITRYATTVIVRDFEYITEAFNGFSLKCLLALALCFPLTLSKIIWFTINHLRKPLFKGESLKINSETKINREDSIPAFSAFYYKEKLGYTKDNLVQDEQMKYNRAKVLNEMRMYLYAHDLKLQGHILRKVNHRVSDNDLLACLESNSIIKPFSTTQITFGNDLNVLLSKVLEGVVTLKKRSMSNETYIIVKDDDYGFLEERLKQIYFEPIRVVFD